MSHEISGTVHAVLPKESGVGKNSGQPWSRQTVVIKWMGGTEDFPKECFLALTNQNRAEEFARLRVGDKITAKFRATSREYNGKWYHDITCFAWQIEESSAAPAAPAAPSAPAAPAAPAPAAAPAAGESLDPQNDDLPF